jgi:hypothetical protein
MGRKIAAIKVVCNIVEWCDGGMGEEIGPGDRVIGVEFCV